MAFTEGGHQASTGSSGWGSNHSGMTASHQRAEALFWAGRDTGCQVPCGGGQGHSWAAPLALFVWVFQGLFPWCSTPRGLPTAGSGAGRAVGDPCPPPIPHPARPRPVPPPAPAHLLGTDSPGRSLPWSRGRPLPALPRPSPPPPLLPASRSPPPPTCSAHPPALTPGAHPGPAPGCVQREGRGQSWPQGVMLTHRLPCVCRTGLSPWGGLLLLRGPEAPRRARTRWVPSRLPDARPAPAACSRPKQVLVSSPQQGLVASRRDLSLVVQFARPAPGLPSARLRGQRPAPLRQPQSPPQEVPRLAR